MPDRDGLEVTMAFHHESPTVKIIVLTGGSGQRDYLDVAKLLGAHRTMRKPVTMTELLQAVQQELQEDSPSPKAWATRRAAIDAARRALAAEVF